MWAGWTSNEKPAWVRSSRRRGEAEARTSILQLCREAGVEAGGGGEAPGHGGGVVGEAEAAVGSEEDDAAMAAETVIEVGDGFLGGEFRGGAVGDAVGGPLAEDQLHDGFAPAGERDGGGEIVGVAAATDEGGGADTAGRLVEGGPGGGWLRQGGGGSRGQRRRRCRATPATKTRRWGPPMRTGRDRAGKQFQGSCRRGGCGRRRFRRRGRRIGGPGRGRDARARGRGQARSCR